MSSKLELIGLPAIVDAFYGLRNITRKFKVKGIAVGEPLLETEAFVPYGTQDPEFPNALLTAQRIDPLSDNQSTDAALLTRTYRELLDDELVGVGEDKLQKLEDGRTVLVRTSVCKAEDAAGLAPEIGDIESGRAVSDVQITYDGIAATVVVTYTSAGKLSETTQENYNGKLIYKTLTYYNEEPPTPEGFVLVDKDIKSTEGVPTYTYRFAKGDGEISRTTQTRNNGKLSIVTVRHLTGPEVDTNPIDLPGGSYLISEDGMQEADGHRVWTKTFAYGFGRIGLKTQWLHNGKLIIRTVRWLGEDDPDADPVPGVLIEQGTDEGDGWVSGFEVYAEGVGEISRRLDTSNNDKLLRLTIRHLSPPDVDTNPIDNPGIGWYRTETGSSQESGYILWTATYVSGVGRIKTDVDTQHNGALTITTIRFLGTDSESTPLGALIDSSVEEGDGYKVYVRRYAYGTGEISRTTETRNNGKLTIISIRHLSDYMIVVNPIASPGGGFALVETGSSEASGHKVWNSTYASGEGRVSTSVESKYNDKLIITRIRFFDTDDGAAPDGVKVDESTEQGNGYLIKTQTWVWGTGEISNETETRNNGKLSIIRIRYVSLPDETDLPIETPADYVLTDVSKSEADGYINWAATFAKGEGRVSIRTDTRYNGALVLTTVRYLGTDDGDPPDGVVTDVSTEEASGYQVINKTYAKGDGVISDREDIRNNGQLLMRTIRKLGSAPDAPAGYLMVSKSEEQSDGYVIHTRVFAKGQGIISNGVSRSYNNKLVHYKIVSLSPANVGTPPATPAATIGGTVNLVDTEERQEEGHILYSYRWAEGNGIISEKTDPREDGLRTQTYVSLGVKMVPFGVVVREDVDQLDGVVRNTVTCMQSGTGSTPNAVNLQFQRFHPFQYPGRAKAYKRTVAGSGRKLAAVFLSPPIESEVRATVTITYTTVNNLTDIADYWQVKEWATVQAQFLSNYGKPIDRVKGLRGYRSVSNTPVEIEAPAFPNPENPGGTIFGDNVYGGTTGVLTVFGGPPNPVGQTYTLEARQEPAFQAVDGTVWYRRIRIQATIPAQPALPL